MKCFGCKILGLFVGVLLKVSFRLDLRGNEDLPFGFSGLLGGEGREMEVRLMMIVWGEGRRMGRGEEGV